jgi:hypothetical protein
MTSFPITSRYYSTATAQLQSASGRTINYLRRRFISAARVFDMVAEHTIVSGDRLDNISAQYLGDPEQFWRICDANDAMQPDELTATLGRKLRIALPEGVPGQKNA